MQKLIDRWLYNKKEKKNTSLFRYKNKNFKKGSKTGINVTRIKKR